MLIWRKSIVNPSKNDASICKEMTTDHGLTLSKDIIRCPLNVTGLYARVPLNKKSEQSIRKPTEILLGAQNMHNQRLEEILSNEYKFNLFQSYGRRYIRRQKCTRTDPRINSSLRSFPSWWHPPHKLWIKMFIYI